MYQLICFAVSFPQHNHPPHPCSLFPITVLRDYILNYSGNIPSSLRGLHHAKLALWILRGRRGTKSLSFIPYISISNPPATTYKTNT